MLDTNISSGHFGGTRTVLECRGHRTLRVTIFFAAFMAIFPVCLVAQTASVTNLVPTQGSAYGTGPLTPLRFEGEPGLENQASISFGAAAIYDGDVEATNTSHSGDEAISLTSDVGIEKQTSHMVFSFDYLPYFLIYRQFDQYDRLNHSANLNFAYRLSPRVILGVHGNFSYQDGILPALTGQTILSGPPSPTGLNQGIYSYTTRVLANTAGLDLTFVKSRRNSLTFSADYNQRKFGGGTAAVESLYNSLGASAGLQYVSRVTDHTTFGMLLLHQDTTYRGGTIFGSTLRTQIETGYLSLGSRLSPTVSVTVFGGPQYVRTLGAVTAASTLAGRFQAAGGGSLTVEARQTAYQVSFMRSVTDGGGLYTSVISTNIGFGARRHLFGRWDGDLRGGLTRADASLFDVNGTTDAVTAGVDFTRPVRVGSQLRISYDTMHQVSNGSLPIFGAFDRNQVTIGVDFRLKAISLGQ